MNNFLVFLKKGAPYIVSLLILFLAHSVIYTPQFSGKNYPSGDIVSYVAKSHETTEFYNKTGERSEWNPSMFSGMPGNLLVLGSKNNILSQFNQVWSLFITKPIGLFFQVGFICFISLCLLGISPWLALLGALAYSLNPNYAILFEAGHMSKINVISFFPLIVAGTVLCFKNEYIKGASAIALGTSFAILNNHIQMVYYLIFGLVVIGIVYLIYSLKEKTFSVFWKASLIALVAAALAGLSNFSQLYSSKNFSEDTMRGEPILEKQGDQSAQSSSETIGLDWEYAMAWSHDTKDVLAMFIPRFVGGASGERVSPDSKAGKLMRRIGVKPDKGKFLRTPSYWGNLPFTGGTSYMGITLIFLFIFSLFVIEPKMRWALLGAVFLLTLFSMGKYASWINRMFFDYVPLFNKFRSPNSAVNVIPFFLVLGSILGLHGILKNENKKQYIKPLIYTASLLGGVVLFLALFGSNLFNFIKDAELAYDEQVQDVLRDARISLQSSDSWRSFFFVLGFGSIIWAYLSGKIKNKYYVIFGLGLVLILDLIPVDKRHIKTYDFVSARQYDGYFATSQNDEYIFQNEPKGKGFYRVLDLSVNTFNDAKPSYHHHQVGGYDAAKLQRYQDMVDQYISKIYRPVLNMLNTKYIIGQDKKMSVNSEAFGTAWFVKEIITANSAREEIDAISGFGPDTAAVVLMNEFANQNIKAGDGSGNIELVQFQPNKLTYNSSSDSDQVAIFSEIWFGPNKGWEVTIDGQKTDHFRANYILRGMVVPKGQHEIIFEFKPRPKLAWISTLSSLLIIAITLGGIWMAYKNPKTIEA